jgi:hypothetical protein
VSEIPKTPRGFNVYAELKDSYGIRATVQQSSAMSDDEHGASFVWLWVKDEQHTRDHLGEKLYPALHLSPDQARELRDALDQHLREVEVAPGKEPRYAYRGKEKAMTVKELRDKLTALADEGHGDLEVRVFVEKEFQGEQAATGVIVDKVSAWPDNEERAAYIEY